MKVRTRMVTCVMGLGVLASSVAGVAVAESASAATPNKTSPQYPSKQKCDQYRVKKQGATVCKKVGNKWVFTFPASSSAGGTGSL